MKWYTGGIEEAIVAAKCKGAIFVVYIEGTDEQSRKMTELIDNGDLGQQLEQDHFVAIRIEAGSISYQQFSEIFREPSVPSVYFLGKTESPLDIIGATDNLENLNERIGGILEKAGIPQSKLAPSISESLIQSEQASGNSNNYVCENGVCRLKTDVPTTSDIDDSSRAQEKQELTHDEKVQKAKELVEQKRLEKEQQEKEIERLKEIERRKMGQGVQQLKQWQEDQELKQLKEERDREKKENQMARDRVLAQIAQDKAERLVVKGENSFPPIEEAKPTVLSARVNTNTTRLQFKMPDGSSTTQDFINSDLLQTVVTHIKSNLMLPFKDFSLSTVYPRRQFTLGDYSQTLSDLQLTPNAVILVLPMSRGVVSTNPGGSLSAMLWNLMAPLFNLFGYLRNFVFGTGASIGGSKRPSEDSTETRAENSKRRMRDSTVVKRQGNVYRLGDRRDSDDDQNTWNGNSTQQM